MKHTITLIFLCLAFTIAFSQHSHNSRLKVFIDCSNTWCDMQHIRSAINIVDFLRDNVAADVHVLITSQYTGSGGNEYQLIFYGQQDFSHEKDTIVFNMHPDATEFENREQLLNYIKSGLIPFIVKTSAAKYIRIDLTTTDSARTTSADTLTEDPWNAWVFYVGAGGNINADANYTNKNYNGGFSASRLTEKTKIGFSVNTSQSKSSFEFEDAGEIETFIVNNHNWSVNHYLVKSIGPKWSWSYETKYSQNTFSNNKGRAYLLAAVEYNLFPYTEVNQKLFTISYGITSRNNQYYDTTIYDQTKEFLWGHRLTADLSLNQKWGNAYAGITYHNYFNNWKFFNLGVEIYTSIRITGGLSCYVSAFGGLTRDQIFLVKGNASPEEVLARRRQLASGYNYYTSIGLNYRFGSKLNNVVNPRFDRSSSIYDD